MGEDTSAGQLISVAARQINSWVPRRPLPSDDEATTATVRAGAGYSEVEWSEGRPAITKPASGEQVTAGWDNERCAPPCCQPVGLPSRYGRAFGLSSVHPVLSRAGKGDARIATVPLC